MGLFGLMVGLDQQQAAMNAVMANHLLPFLNSQQKYDIASLIASRLPGNGFDIFSTQCRVTQLNFISLACNNLYIDPLLDDGLGWKHVKNPFVTGSYVKQVDIDVATNFLKRKTGTFSEWPGNNAKVDLVSWYKGEAEA